MRPLLALVLSAGLFAPAAAAPAPLAGHDDPLALLPAATAGPVGDAMRLVDRFRAAARTGSLRAAVDSVAPWGGAEPGEPIGVSPQASLARVAAAVERANSMIGSIPAGETREAWVLVRKALEHPKRPGGLAASPALRRAASRTPRAADLVLSALDSAWPALLATRASASGTAAAGCDVLDLLPHLCVGSGADNAYTEHAALLIDQGGNDTYRNSAGGAPFLPEGSEDLIPVSVNIDLDGDDRYEPEPGAGAEPGTVLANGAGMIGGVGILIDAAGDDTYAAASDGSSLQTVAQGAGVAGVGLLADLGGSDTYLTGSPFAVAQGTGVYCAADGNTAPPHQGAGCPLGILLDRGSGDDRYEVATPSIGPGGTVSVAVQGTGNLGRGILSDDGGADEYRVSTAIQTPLINGPVPTASVSAQGHGILGGIGLLIQGSGPTTYAIEMRSDGLGKSQAAGQGYGGATGGLGVVSDAGGADHYVADLSLEDRRQLEIDDTCACGAASVTVDADPFGTFNSADWAGQGMGYNGGLGMLLDQDGDDEYRATGVHRFDVDLREVLEAPAEPPSLEVRSYGSPMIRGQGLGMFNGAGLLLDRDGSDVYELSSVNRTTAAASSLHASGEPMVAVYARPPMFVAGQGASTGGGEGIVGALIDSGGVADRFRLTVSNPVVAPDPAGVYQAPGNWPRAHGTQNGIFAALGENPDISSSPSRPVCSASPGHRGFGEWLDCPTTSNDPETAREGSSTTNAGQHSIGLAPLAVGRPMGLSFEPGMPQSGVVEVRSPNDPFDTGTPRTPVSARLVDDTGAPVAGATVHLSLHEGCYLLCTAGAPAEMGTLGRWWFGIWEVSAVTDADGRVTATLPLRLSASQWNTGKEYRIVATFDGGAGALPRHISNPIELTRST